MRSLRRSFHRASRPPVWLVLLNVFACAFLAALVYAQPRPGGVSSPEGNWFVEYQDYPERGRVTRAIVTLVKPWEQKCQRTASRGCRFISVRNDAGPWSLKGGAGENYRTSFRLEPSQISITASGKIELNHTPLWLWGGRSLLQQVGPDEIRGRWSQGDKSGTEVWRRAIPRVTRVKFVGQKGHAPGQVSAIENVVRYGTVPARVEFPYWESGWGPGNNMRGNRPRFRVEILGENLWGHHVIKMDDAVDLEPLDFDYILLAPGASAHTYAGAWNYQVFGRVVGLGFEVVIWPQATPGPKTLRIDGIRIPFDFVVKGHPAETRPELRFVRQSGNRFEPVKDELKYGEPFYIEAEFNSVPRDPPERNVRLEWGKGQVREVKVYKQKEKDGRLFRSKVLMLEDPTPCKTKTDRPG